MIQGKTRQELKAAVINHGIYAVLTTLAVVVVETADTPEREKLARIVARNIEKARDA